MFATDELIVTRYFKNCVTVW